MSLVRSGMLPILLAGAFMASCSKAPGSGGEASVLPNPVVIRVDGMQKGEGGKT